MFVDIQVGAVFAGDFQIESVLSEGGMGRVYVARQISTNKRRALKVMLPGLLTDARLRERFVLEAKIGATIESDHVVEVLGAGIDNATQMPWLVMEYLEGETLAALSTHFGALAFDECQSILHQLCHGLAAAHRAGVVHRDLKPENIFLASARRHEVRYTVKILDFGIAKLSAEMRSRATAAIGTPLWMAPEQGVLGASITPATDIWPLGLIAFQLLTGGGYWLASHQDDLSPIQIYREVAFDPIVSASERARVYGREQLLPNGFDAWFARTVNRDPRQRFQDAGAAYEALAPLLVAQPVSAPPSMPKSSDLNRTIAAAPLGAFSEETFLHEEKVRRRLDRIQDPRAKAFQRYALQKLREQSRSGEQPGAPFDVNYFCKVMWAVFRDRDTLSTILHGDVDRLSFSDD